MRVVIDINHPAHVHFFRNLIQRFQQENHQVLVTASDKDVTEDLLKNYDINYLSMGSYGATTFQKFMNIPIMDIKMWKKVQKFDPDCFLGIASVRAAHTAAFMKKPSYIFDDTENGTAELQLYRPFATRICTPECYQNKIGAKQVCYNGYHELAYLHPDYFKPAPDILDLLGLWENEKYSIVRFVSWSAIHDRGHKGLTLENKRNAVQELAKHGKVFISSEKELPEDLKRYQLQIPPERMHDALYYASLLFGESATMASECSVLGTPAIFIDNAGRGYTTEQQNRYGTVFNFTESETDQAAAIEKASFLLQQVDLKKDWRLKAQKLIHEHIDPTDWMYKLITEN